MIHKDFYKKDEFLAHLDNLGFSYSERKYDDGPGIYGEVRIDVYMGDWVARYEISDHTGRVCYCGAYSMKSGRVIHSYARRCFLERQLKMIIK